MTDHPTPPDPLAELLAPPAPDAANADLRQVLFRQTARVLRRRRWLKRAGYASALAACYLAGLMTMKFLPTAPATDRGTVEVARADPSPPPPPAAKEAAEPKPSPLDLEWQAADSRVPRPDLLRQAGDRYLEEAGDVVSALRCYRGVLRDNPAEAETFSADDNWLLMALKEAKAKEKRHAKVGG